MNILLLDVPLGLLISVLCFASVLAYLWGRARGMVLERQRAREAREHAKRVLKESNREHPEANPDLPPARVSKADFSSGIWDNSPD